MRPSLLDTLLWVTGPVLQLTILIALFRRGILRKYLAFTVYVIFWVSEFLIGFPLHLLGFLRAYYFLYWGATAISAILSLLIIIQLTAYKLRIEGKVIARSLLVSSSVISALILVATDFSRVPTAIILNVNFQARIAEAVILAIFFTLCISKHRASGFDFDIAFGLSMIVSVELIGHFIVNLHPAAERLGNYATILSSLGAWGVWLRGAILHPEFCEIDLASVLAPDNEAQEQPCEQQLEPAGSRYHPVNTVAEPRPEERPRPRRKKRKSTPKVSAPPPEDQAERSSPDLIASAVMEATAQELSRPAPLQSPSKALTPPVPHDPGAIRDRYSVKGLLGVGSYGMVYKAYDNELARYVVLKFVLDSAKDDPRMLKRFRREAAIATRLEHKNICRVYGLIETQINLAVVMEFVSGRNLERFVFPNRQEAEIAALIPIFIEIADGLSYAHSAGVIHRDIKPSNVMFSRAGLVKIVDFGIAKSTIGDLSTTTSDEPRGALAYAAPELLQGQPGSVQSDIYAFGCLMYTLATGEHPFIGQSRKIGWEQAILDNSPKRPTWFNPKISQQLERIILRAMTRDLTQRYSSVMNIWLELQSLLEMPNRSKKGKRKKAA